MTPTLLRAAISLLVAWPVLAMSAPPAPAVSDTPYPGRITLQVDASDLDHRIFRVHETLPVAPGPLTLYYPQWLPGHHAPVGRIDTLAGLKIEASGRPVAWQRDPLDIFAFKLVVPPGASSLEIEFQQLSPVSGGSGRVVMTPEMLDLEWSALLLYPGGHPDRSIAVAPRLRLPEDWASASALEPASKDGGTTSFKPVSVEALIDSPVYAGKYFARVDLDPDAVAGGRPPVFLDVMADTAAELTMTPEQLAAHRALVTQADRLFGTRHYAHYDMLLAISDHLGGTGLEHHQSSENAVDTGYFSDWSKSSVVRDLLPHEYTHSWNGKFRRPADLWTPNTNTPMQDSLLWMYEGQTQYWGKVLAARAGLLTQDDTRDGLADVAAWAAARSGRVWRSLQDTTNQPLIDAGRSGHDWSDWQRGADYYDEMALVWLEADLLIREGSSGQRSLDDFARAFFGPVPGRAASDWTPVTYRFEDIVAALNRVQPHDWARFLRERLDTTRPGAPLEGLEHSGWRLAWSEEPSAYVKNLDNLTKSDGFAYSIGFDIDKDDRLARVRWGSPAFDAGLHNSVKLIAVDGLAYKVARLKSAITAAKTSKQPIQLLVQDGEHFKTVAINYDGGLRYPKLERIDGRKDRLADVLAAKP